MADESMDGRMVERITGSMEKMTTIMTYGRSDEWRGDGGDPEMVT